MMRPGAPGGPGLIIGLDFDNTLADYDALFLELAAERGLFKPSSGVSKKDLRDAVRRLPKGEIEWQKLQGLAYGSLIGRARVPDGVAVFVARCRRERVTLKIVSHKTRHACYDLTRTDLWAAAFGFMRQNRFFGRGGMGFSESDVFFEVTRQDKIRRIAGLGCRAFVDDLEETFIETSFPRDVMKVLYAPQGAAASHGCQVARSWAEVGDCIFGSTN